MKSRMGKMEKIEARERLREKKDKIRKVDDSQRKEIARARQKWVEWVEMRKIGKIEIRSTKKEEVGMTGRKNGTDVGDVPSLR